MPSVVSSVDLARYAGKWYEIASYPVSFQKGCSCIRAEYSLTDKGYVKVFILAGKEEQVAKRVLYQGKHFLLRVLTMPG